jgi:CRP-like cAMP-binding protein
MINSSREIKNIESHILQTLVPVNVLTRDHVHRLLRDQSVEAVFAGQTLFAEGEYDAYFVYLLSGDVTLTHSSDLNLTVSANDLSSHHPLVHYKPRRHNAVAKTDCSVIRFNSEQLDSMLTWDQASSCIMADMALQGELDEDADWVMTLLKSNLFYQVPPMNIKQILTKFES